MSKSKSQKGDIPERLIEQPLQRDTPPLQPVPPIEAISWPNYIKESSETEITSRFCKESLEIINSFPEISSNYCVLGLMDTEGSISDYELDRIYDSIRKNNNDKSKNILLVILCRGGKIEPAFQISKICKAYSRDKFVVCVPRRAKSAATLLALGADEIHMGALGQLGPIDPQLDGLPALGVSQALESLASLSEKHPKSADLFARYLRSVLTVEQIGYCQRISESAIQYAERLLSTKPFLKEIATNIATELVTVYKDHGFVIDLDEARLHMGNNWILSNTQETIFAESIYSKFELVNLFTRVFIKRYLQVAGSLVEDAMLFNIK